MKVIWFFSTIAKAPQFQRTPKRLLIISQGGKSTGIKKDALKYEKLIEKLELLTDIQIAESQLEKGEGITHEDAKDQILHQAILKKNKKAPWLSRGLGDIE